MSAAHPSSEHSTQHPADREPVADRSVLLGEPPRPSVQVGFGTPAEWRRTLDWLECGLRSGRPGRLRAEYPLLMEPNPSVVPIVLSEAHAPRSACLLWAREFRVLGAPLRVGMISLVYTHPEARGRGFARHVVRRAIAEAKRRDLGLVLLWSEADALYRDLDFVEAGAESVLILDREIVERAIEVRVEARPAPGFARKRSPDRNPAPLRPTPPSALDWAEIERVRTQRASTLILEADEFARLHGLPDMRALCLRGERDERGGFGFAIRGRGDDFADVIHEWGGEPELALRCCRALLDDRGPDRELMFLSPAERTEVGWALRSAGARVLRNPLAWFRIASPGALADDLRGLDPALPPFALTPSAVEDALPTPSSSRPPEPGDRMPSPSRRISIESPLGETTVTEATLLHALFGSSQKGIARAAHEQLASVFGADIEARWPLPFYVCGLESI